MRGRQNEMGYDSVLDTMTNVVGILVIVAAVSQVSVSQWVSGKGAESARRQDEIIDVSPEALQLAREERQHLVDLLADLEERLGAFELTPPQMSIELERIREMIATLERERSDPITSSADPDSLRSLLANLEREIQRLEREREEAARTARALSQSATEEPPVQAEKLALPDPDEKRAEGREQVCFFCKGGKVYEFHREELAEKWFGESAAILKNGSPSTWIEFLKLWVDHFDRRDYGDRTFRIRGAIVNAVSVLEGDGETARYMGNVSLEFHLRESAVGDDINAVRLGRGQFAQALDRCSVEKSWAYFYVFDDSFDIYLAARDQAERRGLPVGWIAYGPEETVGSLCFDTGSSATGPVPQRGPD